MKAQVKFTKRLDGYGGSGTYRKNNFMLCGAELRYFFDIPKNTKSIVVKLSTTPIKQSYKFTKSSEFAEIDIYLSNGDKKIVIMNENTKVHLLNLIGSPETCYVAVEY